MVRLIATSSCDTVITGDGDRPSEHGVVLESGERPQPPGRGPKVRAAVLAATLAELADTGYAALTVENIARRAGVHKTTIYRRWTDRESLVADVLGERIAMDFPIPDTGSVQADLRLLAQAFVAWVTSSTGRMIFAAVYSDAARIPGISDVRRELFEYGPRSTARSMTTAAR